MFSEVALISAPGDRQLKTRSRSFSFLCVGGQQGERIVIGEFEVSEESVRGPVGREETEVHVRFFNGPGGQ